MTESTISTSRRGRPVKRRSFAEFLAFDDSPERDSEEETKKTSRKPTKKARRFQETVSKRNRRKRKACDNILTDYQKPSENTDAEIVTETVYYRPSNNSMFIPSITADMIQDDGKSLTVQTSCDDYFKFARNRQTTKNDHADPRKVFAILRAVRKRPIIWDQRLVCHENMPLIRRAWQQIDAELGFDEEYPLARRKQIWKSKKDYYSFALNSDTLGKWMYSSAMEFYYPMVNFRTTVCLRPTLPCSSTSSSSSANLYDKVVLGDKNVKCTSSDKKNVLAFLLKSLHEIGMADSEMMAEHGQKMLKIFQNNLEEMTSKVELEEILM
ncbi:hypothetical protein CAEBREN_32806 [Caenorhabditis brenneri]|uniref:MADF domain-containing protein n=1 Tax=Caenorhabditis brenneri TaxID=135651 RepID=G0N5Q8_CAEBE|nr:hypothetical protein CAEBREN_32806 [Caenorhabditis brenneri]